ncbi:hypothetical protein [Haliangium ochraceum]|uniref:hypothetical protein n=1 Tax=Haliangium ochraceum TaxID=80816 RepID=UPI00019BA809|nr:hypothetical protein [Haliangium ochraceum]
MSEKDEARESDSENAATPRPEPRVGELFDRGAEALEDEELDPETIAQLAAWFGGPAPDAGGAATAQTTSAHVARPNKLPPLEAARRRANALRGVEPGFLRHMERKWRGAEALLGVSKLVGASARGPISEFDHTTGWLFAGLEEATQHEQRRPEEVADWLTEPTPQAILRDLHRPDQTWPKRIVSQDVGPDVAGAQMRTKLDEILHTVYAVRMDDEPVPARLVAEDMHALRLRLDEPWEDSYVPPEERRGEGSYAPTAEDMKWFGIVGFDPDL